MVPVPTNCPTCHSLSIRQLVSPFLSRRGEYFICTDCMNIWEQIGSSRPGPGPSADRPKPRNLATNRSWFRKVSEVTPSTPARSRIAQAAEASQQHVEAILAKSRATRWLAESLRSECDRLADTFQARRAAAPAR
jgi:hypothetical protein